MNEPMNVQKRHALDEVRKTAEFYETRYRSAAIATCACSSFRPPGSC
jgi:hypothetical protein